MYIFLTSDGGVSYSERQKLVPPFVRDYYNFGFSVSVSGDLIAVGSYVTGNTQSDDDEEAADSGLYDCSIVYLDCTEVSASCVCYYVLILWTVFLLQVLCTYFSHLTEE